MAAHFHLRLCMCTCVLLMCSPVYNTTSGETPHRVPLNQAQLLTHTCPSTVNVTLIECIYFWPWQADMVQLSSKALSLLSKSKSGKAKGHEQEYFILVLIPPPPQSTSSNPQTSSSSASLLISGKYSK